MTIGTSKRALLVVGLVSLVSGCSGAPDEGDVRSAVEQSLSQTNADLVQMVGAEAAERSQLFELKDFKLLGCEEIGKKNYNCDVQMSMDTPVLSMKDKTSTVRLRQTDGNWVVMQGAQ